MNRSHNIQFLDGIDIALLDGTNTPSLKTAEEYHGFFTRNHNAQTDRELDTIARGLDLAGYRGDGSVSDSEKVRAYLVRTKMIADNNPELLIGYQNPRHFSQMLGCVIGAWDTADREQAIEEMAGAETELIKTGNIVNEAADFEFLKSDEDVLTSHHAMNGLGQARIRKEYNGFFNHLKNVTSNPQLTEEEREIVSANPFIDGIKNKRRADIARRRYTKIMNTEHNGVKKVIAQRVANTDGLAGVDDTFDKVLNGTSLLGTGALGSTDDKSEAYKQYLIDTRDAVAASDDEDRELNLGILTYAINNWDTPNRERAINALCGVGMTDEEYERFIGIDEDDDDEDDDDELEDGFLGKSKKKKAKKAEKKAKKAEKKAKKKEKKKKRKAKIKKFFKKVGSGIKKAAKKVGKGIKKAAKAVGKALKKVAKFLIRFNPLTILIRAGIRVAFRMNMFKMAIKAFPAIATDEELAQYGFTTEDRDKAKKQYKKVLKLFKGIGGKQKNIEQSIRKGFKKKWKGGDDFSKDAMAQAANTPEAEAANAEEQQDEQVTAEAEGAIDNNAAVMTVEDAEQNADNMEQAAEAEAYNAKIQAEAENESEESSEAEESEEAEEETDEQAEEQVSGIIYGVMLNGGLGEAAAAASTAAASGFIAKIVALIKKLGSGIKKVAGKVKGAVKKVTDKIKNGKLVSTIKNVKSKVQTASENSPVVSTLVNVGKKLTNKAVDAIANTKAGKKLTNFLNPETGEYIDDPTAVATSKKSNAKTLLLVGGGLAAVGLVAYLALRKKDTPTVQAQPAQQLSGVRRRKRKSK